MPTDPNNAAALDAVAKLIDGVDPIIGRYDDLNQRKATLETALAESEELERSTLADENLDHQTATERLINARTKSDVLRARVESTEQKIANQLKVTIDAGRLTQSAAYSIWYQLHQHRILRAHDLFGEHFRLPYGLRVDLNAMMRDSTLAQEVETLRVPFEYDQTHPAAYNLGRMRQLEQGFTKLRTAVEAEPGLVLQSPASAPEVSVVAA
jgi:hypothetical protein